MFTLPAKTFHRHEIVIKRSRFISTVARVENETQARDFINQIKSEFPDARHNCSAYIVPADGVHEIERSSDDGEPSGTAGTPMLDVIRGENLTRTAVVVTRYFGGTLLGAGGLVHAYSQSVSEVLENLPKLKLEPAHKYQLSVPHAEAGKVEAALRGSNWDVLETQYAATAKIILTIDPSDADNLEAICAALTKGSSKPEYLETITKEIPVS